MTTTVEFEAGTGAPFSDDDVSVLGAYFMEFANRNNGVLDVEALLKDAENPKSPLHRFLQWDDAVAAKQYRIEQIKKIIRFIRYKVETEGKVLTPRAFASVVLKDELPGTEPGRAIVKTSVVLQHSTLSDQVLERAMRELRQWRERYSMNRALIERHAPIFEAIEEWEKQTFSKKKTKK